MQNQADGPFYLRCTVRAVRKVAAATVWAISRSPTPTAFRPCLASCAQPVQTLDIGIIVPTSIIAGVLVWRKDLLRFVLAFPLFGLIVMFVPTITLSTISQLCAGIAFTLPAIIEPIAGFFVLGSLAAWALVAILRVLAADAGRPKSIRSVDA